MNDKNLNNRELAIIKRIAQNVDADFQKVCKLETKIKELTAEANEISKSIEEMEAPVVRMTGGYKSTDIFKKTIIPQFNEDGSPKTDKDGRQLKVTKYVLRYKDSILPPTENTENTESLGTENVESMEQVADSALPFSDND